MSVPTVPEGRRRAVRMVTCAISALLLVVALSAPSTAAGTPVRSATLQSAVAASSGVATPHALAAESPFVDVRTDHVYYAAIYDLWFWDIIDGYPRGDGSAEFRPDNPVARQHFTKMIVRGLIIPVSELDVCPFADVEVSGLFDLYPDNYIAAAFREGIVYGKSPAVFDAYGNIRRAQLISMVVRAVRARPAAHLEEPDPGLYNGYMKSFTDPTHGYNAQVAEWNGLLDGIDLRGWDPWASATRGEVAQILYNTRAHLLLAL